ncbi:MAG: MCE family protein [Geobacteraceae bacterium]|nr:MCE family protein [Geobacteraceae bacterium]
MIHKEDPRFRNLERKIGIFIATALAGILIAAVLFGLQKDFFTRKYSLSFTTDSGTGFTKGMPVKLSGFRIGRVTGISLNNLAMVDVSLEIDADYLSWIRSDSIAKLVKEGLVGDSVITISVGSPDKTQLKDKDSIVFIPTRSLDELADEVAKQVKTLLAEVNGITRYINDPDGDLKKTIRNAEQLTRNLEGTRQNADRLLVSAADNVQLVTSRATILMDSTNKKIDSIDLNPTLTRVNSTLDHLDKKLPALLDKADTTLLNISRISYETRLLSEKSFPRIPGLISQAEDVMLSSDRLINSLQNSWLLRDSSVPVRKQDLITGDSYE